MDNVYDGVALAAWPLRALAERGLADECERALSPLLARAAQLANPVNRLDGLELVLHAVVELPSPRRRVLAALVEACRAAASWKAPRCLARCAVVLAAYDRGDAGVALAALPDGPHRRHAEREITAGGAAARTFFA